MCELFAMSARRPATVNLSLEEFSHHGCETMHYEDGWGIAYAHTRGALVLKESTPACDSDLVRYVETHRLRSHCVISQIRRASYGGRSFENAQPFSRELAGRTHVFAHNGDLPDLFGHRELRIGRYTPLGETDSERAFCLLLDEVQDLWTSSEAAPKLEDRLAAVSRFAKALRAMGPANFVYWDGDALFVHGHRRRASGMREPVPPGLHFLLRSCPVEPSAFEAPGVSVVSDEGEQSVCLVASVPLSDEPWEALAEGELIAISAGEVLARVSP